MKINIPEIPTVKEKSPPNLNSPADSIPFSIEGIQTVIKNKLETNEKELSADYVLRSESMRYKNENIQLRNALKEAAKVNQQWRTYDEHRQAYVQKLLNMIQDLQQTSNFERLSELERRLIVSNCSSHNISRHSTNGSDEFVSNSPSIQSRDSSRLSSPSKSEFSFFQSQRNQQRSVYSENHIRDKESTSSSDSLEMVSHSAVHEATFPNIQAKERLKSVDTTIEQLLYGDESIEFKSYKRKVCKSPNNVDDQKEAKHRARSILASALSITPPTSIPSSPIPQSESQSSSFSTTSNFHQIHNNCDHSKKKRKSHLINPSVSESCNNFLSTANEHHIVKQIQTVETAIVKNKTNHNSLEMQEKHNYFKTDYPLVASEVTSKMKLNKKVLTITNNQSDKHVVNYASISVMPGAKSALYSTSQITSTTSSRSSSPGISLTTFAMNDKGQGIPGAMFLALGLDNKNNATHVSSVSNGLSKRDNGSPTTSRLVNSTWVKLMNKENNSFPSGTPWRTARAVPSHQLSTVKRSNQEETSINYAQISTISPTFHYCDSPQITIPYHLAPRGITTTSPVFYTTSSHVCNGPETNISKSEISNSENTSIKVKSDMILKASKNISSAILSYECAHKLPNCKASSMQQTLSKNVHSNNTILSNGESAQQKLKCYLICPSCQMLFPEEQRTKFVHHLPICAGPEYIDM